MLIRYLTVFLALFSLLLAPTAVAQDAPEITFRSDNELGEFEQKGLFLEKLDVSINIRAGLAQISLGATLRNDTEEDAEATFAYPLPQGAVINGYALDLDGELVDGVLMSKERAEDLYTDRVTQSVDPGIAARTIDNRYKTRIYPIESEGGRRSIRLDFTAPVPEDGLRLPFTSTQAIEQASIEITGDGAEQAQTPFSGQRAENIILSGDIFIPAVPAEAVLSEHKGQSILTVPLNEPYQTASKPTATTPVNSVAVIWDTSLSRSESDLASERRFVTSVLSALSPERQSLIHGADRAEFAARYDTSSALVNTITRLSYDGATDLAALLDIETLKRDDINPEICLLISDGKSSLGQSGLPILPCRVFTFSAAKHANADWLSLLATRNNGADLSGLNAKDAASLIAQDGGLQLAPGQFGEILTFGNRHWFIAPVDNDARSFTLNLKDSSQGFNLNKLSSAPHLAAGSIWGQRHMTELRAWGSQNFDAIVKASRRWGVQGEETSFLVLESADDYIEANIKPPKTFPSDRMESYKEELLWKQEEEADDRDYHLKQITTAWENQVAWWKTDWTKRAKARTKRATAAPQVVEPAPAPPPPAPNANFQCWDGSIVFNTTQCPAQAVTSGSVEQNAAAPVLVPAPETSEAELDIITVTGSRWRSSDEDEVVVSGARIGERSYTGNDGVILSGSAGENSNPGASDEITISTRAWTPDRPFLKALDGLDGAAFEREYLAQRKTHGDLPSFYLEVADQLQRRGKIDRAARMAATALELASTTTTTRSNVADRLLMYGDVETAIALYRDILPTAQDRPQPYYNLALALIQAGDAATGEAQETLYGEAFEHLVHVILEPWEDDYEGIHLIALQDMNRTLARMPKRKQRRIQKDLGLDKIFFQNLPVDMRVLVDWTGDDADLDMHVMERANSDDEEEAYYGNRATEIGGRVSNDMTEGYGPEEYMIREAPDGLYRVESEYYSQDDYSQDGAINLRARIWRNFGSKNETFETVIIEMLEEKENAYILGEIQVGVAEPSQTE